MHRYETQILGILSRFRHVIWDWNGTLLDDAAVVLEVNNQILVENGLPRITLDDYRHQFRHPVKDYYLGLGFDMKKVSFEEIGDRFVQLYKERVGGVGIFRGVPEVLGKLCENGTRQWILSAAHEEHLKSLVPRYGIAHFFDGIFGLGHHYADSKVARGRDLLKKIDASTDDIVLVGDTDHDFEVAQALGVEVLLVSNGHQSATRLRTLTDNVLGG